MTTQSASMQPTRAVRGASRNKRIFQDVVKYTGIDPADPDLAAAGLCCSIHLLPHQDDITARGFWTLPDRFVLDNFVKAWTRRGLRNT